MLHWLKDLLNASIPMWYGWIWTTTFFFLGRWDYKREMKREREMERELDEIRNGTGQRGSL